MPRTFVDLSIYLENDVLSDPPPFAPQIEYFTHEHTVEQIQPFFPGLQKNDLPDMLYGVLSRYHRPAD